jgi:Tfp pilus assembly protein FimV
MLAEALLAIGDWHQAHEIARLALERDDNNSKARAVFAATVERYRAHQL